MDEEDYSYATLVNRWRRERAATALTRMDGHFYEGFDKHLRELRDEYQKEHALHPATPKVLILQDELMNLQRVRDDIYDLRERKLFTSALIAARGGNPDRANMTKEEEILFDEVLRVLRDARRNLLRRGAPAKEAPKPAAGPPTPPEALAQAPPPAAQPASVLTPRSPESHGPESPLPGAPTPQTHVTPAPEQVATPEEREPRRMGPLRVLVRVNQAVAPFVGTDLRQYHLEPEDIAALPKEIAHVLVQRGMATPVGA